MLPRDRQQFFFYCGNISPRFRPRRPISVEISNLRGRYYSAPVCAQVHSLFLYCRNYGGIIPLTSRLLLRNFYEKNPIALFARLGKRTQNPTLSSCTYDHETNGVVYRGTVVKVAYVTLQSHGHLHAMAMRPDGTLAHSAEEKANVFTNLF